MQAFDDRAHRYDGGWRGKLHHEIAEHTAAIAREFAPPPRRVLDVGCGSGFLLRCLAATSPATAQLVGIDPAPRMIREAKALAGDKRLTFVTGVAEKLPYPDETFDLVVSTTSFDHWVDQRAGLAECARTLTAGGHLVLSDLFSPLFAPLSHIGRHERARTVTRAEKLLADAGFRTLAWRHIFVIIGTVVARERV